MNALGTIQFKKDKKILPDEIVNLDLQNKDSASEDILATGNQTSDLLITHIRAVSRSS